VSELTTFGGVTVTRLPSGYFHLRGVGPCNWAQPEHWPCSEEELEAAFFHEAGASFRRVVAAENARLLGGADA
jgi:hypothetical protein